jgi:carbon starvation protein CstA
MPPISPVTLDDRITAIGGAAMMACIIFAIGLAIHKAISKNSDSKRIQGRRIVWWVTILYFLGACLGAWMADNQKYYLNEVVGGMGGIGLLIGLGIGNLHGFLDLLRTRRGQMKALEPCSEAFSRSHSANDTNPYTPPRLQEAVVNRPGTRFKVVALTGIGFVVPIVLLLSVEYAFVEFVTQRDWRTFWSRYLPPATGCSLLFLASAITSSTPRRLLTFVQSLFLYGTTFVACTFAFVPIQPNKAAIAHLGILNWIPFVAVLLLFIVLVVIGSIPIEKAKKDQNPATKDVETVGE